MDNRGGEVVIVPPEYYGIQGAAGALNRMNREREDKRRFNKESSQKEEEIGLEGQRVGIEQQRADLEKENAALTRADWFMEHNQPDVAARVVQEAGIPLTDNRLSPTLQQLLDQNVRTSLDVPANQRTPEDLANLTRVYPQLQGMSPEQYQEHLAAEAKKLNLDIDKAVNDAKYRKQWEESLIRDYHMSPGQVQAKMDYFGIRQAAANVTKTYKEAEQAGATAAYYKAQAAAKEDPILVKTADIYGNSMATWGVPFGTTMKMLRGEQLSDQEEEVVATALRNAATKAAETKNTAEMLSVFTAMLKDPAHGGVVLSSESRSLATSLFFNKLFGKDIMKVEPTTSWTGRKGLTLVPDMKLINQLLGGKDDTLENIKAKIAKEPNLELALADAQSTNSPYKPLIIQAIEEEARRRGTQLQINQPTPVTPKPANAPPAEAKPEKGPATPEAAAAHDYIAERNAVTQRYNAQSQIKQHKQELQSKVTQLTQRIQQLSREDIRDDNGIPVTRKSPNYKKHFDERKQVIDNLQKDLSNTKKELAKIKVD